MKKVLIVEDDFINALVLQKYLKNIYQVSLARTGWEALQQARQEAFDLILMDINLGDESLDGTETMRRVRQLPRHGQVPIFAVTAYVGEDYQRELLKAGFDAFYTKPLDRGQLLAAIAGFLGQ